MVHLISLAALLAATKATEQVSTEGDFGLSSLPGHGPVVPHHATVSPVIEAPAAASTAPLGHGPVIKSSI